MKYLVSYLLRPHAAMRAGYYHHQSGSMVTDLSPAAWLHWALTENWALIQSFPPK